MSTKTIERAALVIKRDLTLGTLFDRLEKVHGDRQLVTEADGGLSLTYAQAARRVRRWAAGIAAQTEPGDVVVVATPNGYEQLLLCCAAARAGRIPAPVNSQMRKDEIAHVVSDSGATLVLRTAGSGRQRRLHRRRPQGGARRRGGALLHVGHHRQAQGRRPHATGRWWARWPARCCGRRGSTATRRCSPCRWPTSWGSPRSSASRWPASPCYLLPKFNPVKVLDAIEARRATMFIGVPAMYRMLDEAHAAERDLTSVRVWASGADAMPPELAERFKKMGATITVPLLGAMGEAMFAEGYGMVEVGGGVAAKVSPPFLGSGSGPLGEALGFALPGLRDAGRRRRPAPRLKGGEVGELQVKGPGVLKAYWGDDAATAAGAHRGRLAPHRRPRAPGSARTAGVRGPREARDQARRLQRVRPRGGAGCSSSTPTCSRPAWSACPTSGWARSPPPPCGCRGTPPSSRRTSRRGPRSGWRTTRSRSAGSRSTTSPAPAPVKVMKAELAALFD